MENKIFLNHSILTRDWKNFVINLLLFFSCIPILFLLALSAIVWLITLGHLNLMTFFWNIYSRIINKSFPEEEE